MLVHLSWRGAAGEGGSERDNTAQHRMAVCAGRSALRVHVSRTACTLARTEDRATAAITIASGTSVH